MRMKPLMLLPLLLLSGCGGLDYMIEEYNSRFGIHDDRALYPGDIGYDEKDMIEPEYHVYTENSLNIPAPQVEGATYRWQLFRQVPDGGTGEAVMEQELTQKEKTAQTLIIYLPGRVKIGTYQLRLTVTVEGRTYVDTALVSVHAEVVGQ